MKVRRASGGKRIGVRICNFVLEKQVNRVVSMNVRRASGASSVVSICTIVLAKKVNRVAER